MMQPNISAVIRAFDKREMTWCSRHSQRQYEHTVQHKRHGYIGSRKGQKIRRDEDSIANTLHERRGLNYYTTNCWGSSIAGRSEFRPSGTDRMHATAHGGMATVYSWPTESDCTYEPKSVPVVLTSHLHSTCKTWQVRLSRRP